MHLSTWRGMRRRRRKSIFAGLTFSAASGRGSPTLRFCTGFLLLSSVVLCHVTIVRYVDERLRPESGDAAAAPRKLLPVEVERSGEEDARWNQVGGSRRLMSNENEVADQDDRRPHPKKDDLPPPRPAQSVCLDRHIQGLSTVCNHLPCLRALQGARDLPRPSSQIIPADVLRRLNRIPGSLDPVHYALFPFLSEMQWSQGVLGSVGQIGGVHLGQLTVLQSLSVDRASGERLFVSDPFNSSTEHLPPRLSQFDVFRSHLHDFHTFIDSPSPDDRIYVHRGTPSPHLAQLLLHWDLPRFRLISVEASGSADPLEGLELAACLLRDGGIIVLDQPTTASSTDPPAMSTVAAFLARHGTSAISPIFAAGKKLFLTTTNWKAVYADHFRRKQTNLAHLSVVEDYAGYHGDKIFVVR